MSKTTGKKLNILGNVWLFAFFLTLFVMATSALLGNFMTRYIQEEKNVIAVMVDANKLKEENPDAADLPTGSLPGIGVQNPGPTWETKTSVDLFKSAYVNEEGKVTVKSENGEKIIAPGASNEYSYTIKNTGNISLNYEMQIDGVFTISDKTLPLFVRLRFGDTWLIGAKDEWIHIDEVEGVLSQRTLGAKKADVYVFEWMWPYETDKETDKLIGDLNDILIDADANDTSIGDISIGASTQFILEISTTAEVTPGAIPMYGDGVTVKEELIMVCVFIGVALLCLFFIIPYLCVRKLYFVAFVLPPAKRRVELDGKQRDTVDSRATYKRVRLGKHDLAVAGSVCSFQIKRGKIEGGLRFEQTQEGMLVWIDRKIRAVQLFFEPKNGVTTIETHKWAVVDRKHNVYTTTGGIPANKHTKWNYTLGSLYVDEEGKFTVRRTNLS